MMKSNWHWETARTAGSPAAGSDQFDFTTLHQSRSRLENVPLTLLSLFFRLNCTWNRETGGTGDTGKVQRWMQTSDFQDKTPSSVSEGILKPRWEKPGAASLNPRMFTKSSHARRHRHWSRFFFLFLSRCAGPQSNRSILGSVRSLRRGGRQVFFWKMEVCLLTCDCTERPFWMNCSDGNTDRRRIRNKLSLAWFLSKRSNKK